MDSLGKLLLGLCLTVIAGALGGWILGWPFSGLGAISGAIFAVPIGLIITSICALKRWPSYTVLVCSVTQFVGAVGLGLLLNDERDMPIFAALGGQLLGGLAGIIAFSSMLTRPPPPGHCQKCGYNLTGNTSGVCPECGERI